MTVHAGPAQAPVQGSVIEIVSGDTLKIRDDAHVDHYVHLAGVSAPAGLQPYGARSLASLRDLVFRRYVVARIVTVNGRIETGLLRYEGRDINLALLEHGDAWFDAPNAQDLDANLRTAFQGAESEARLQRIGLWRDPNPVAPWEFRAKARRR